MMNGCSRKISLQKDDTGMQLDGHDDLKLAHERIKNRLVSAWTRSLLEKYLSMRSAQYQAQTVWKHSIDKCLLLPWAVDEDLRER
jgi:hypothetical protein